MENVKDSSTNPAAQSAAKPTPQQKIVAAKNTPAPPPFPVPDPEQVLANQIIVAMAGGYAGAFRTSDITPQTQDAIIRTARMLAERAFTI